MEITVQPQYTINVGDQGATASTAISYEVFDKEPDVLKVGHLRMRPVQVASAGLGATVEYYDNNGRGNDWKRAPATILDALLAKSIVNESTIDSSNYVYYEYILKQGQE